MQPVSPAKGAKNMETTGATEQRELRGSQKLLANMAKNGEVPSLDEIKKALALPPSFELKVPNWLIRGTPPAYLELDASLEVPVKNLSDVVNRLVQLNDSTISLKILINGIPFPEIANIQVRNTPGEE
jgi:hypothetical protein